MINQDIDNKLKALNEQFQQYISVRDETIAHLKEQINNLNKQINNLKNTNKTLSESLKNQTSPISGLNNEDTDSLSKKKDSGISLEI